MEFKLTKWQQSNYEISITVDQKELKTYKEKTLKGFQKEMKEPGFRQGQVPLDMVEKKVNPAYVEMGILEEIVHTGTKKVIEENPDIKFIGNIYDLDKEEKDDKTTITIKLDIYPEIETKNEKWKEIKLDPIDDKATDQELEETLLNLRKQYADYKPADTITAETVFKVGFKIMDKDEKEIDTGSVFLGKEEMEEFKALQKIFIGKKNTEEFTLPYKEKDLPPMLHCHKEGKPTNLVCTINDVREISLPDFSPENIKKFFGNEEVKSEAELREKITWLIEKQKNETGLMQAIDGILQKASPSFTITIPKTLIEEEVKTRMKSLEERMGGADGLKQYIEKIWEEEHKKMTNDIENAAKSSLEKFFLLKEIVEKLWIKDPDWNTPLSVETAVYEKLTK